MFDTELANRIFLIFGIVLAVVLLINWHLKGSGISWEVPELRKQNKLKELEIEELRKLNKRLGKDDTE